MQENLKQVKRSKTLNIIAICLLLVLFTASVILAVVAPVFTSNGVASALDVILPDNGVVGANLLPLTNIAPANSVFTKNTTINNISYFMKSGCSLTVGDTRQSFVLDSLPSGYSVLVFNISLSPGTYTFSFTSDILSTGENSEVRFSVDNGALYTSPNYLGSGLRIGTFTLSKACSNLRFFSLRCRASISNLKVEVGSSFTGYVPDYQNSLDDLQNKYDDLQSKYNDLQNKYDNFVSEANFSYLSTVSLENAYYFNQNVPERSGTSSYTFGPNASDNSLPEAERNFTCPVNGFYSNTIYRRFLFGVQLPYAVPAGSTIKLNYTCLCVGASFTGVPFSELWRLGYTYAFFFGQYGYPTIDEPGQMLVVDSFTNANGDIYVKVNQPTSYIAFDVVSRTDNTQRLSGYFSVSDSGVFSLHTDSALGHQWFLAFNTLNVYYQGDMLAAAVDSAKKEGYNKGYQEGKVAGREVGYQEGIKDQGDYTFMGLLGAVFDAPIQAFKGLLSFEVLGVNMTSFVSSLFGLAVILLIIKLILGGK